MWEIYSDVEKAIQDASESRTNYSRDLSLLGKICGLRDYSFLLEMLGFILIQCLR